MAISQNQKIVILFALLALVIGGGYIWRIKETIRFTNLGGGNRHPSQNISAVKTTENNLYQKIRLAAIQEKKQFFIEWGKEVKKMSKSFQSLKKSFHWHKIWEQGLKFIENTKNIIENKWKEGEKIIGK